MKTAVLLAAFGSSRDTARSQFQGLLKEARELFPGLECRLAFTSASVRGRMEGEAHDSQSPEFELNRLADEGFTHVAVQSLHVIPGSEYCELQELVQALAGRFEAVALGGPLLTDDADIRAAARAVLDLVPGKRGPGEAVLVVGHGTRHPGNAQYLKFRSELMALDPGAMLGLIEPESDAREVVGGLLNRGVRTVHLVPLLLGAGRHADLDVGGPSENSWKSRIRDAGIRCLETGRSMADHSGLTGIWLSHLRDALKRLGVRLP